MEKLVEIYRELHDTGVTMIDRPLPFSAETKSAVLRLCDDKYGIFVDSSHLTMAEESVCIAHEAGHIATGSTHAVCSPYDVVARHEYRANKWAIKKLIPKDELDNAVRHGNTEVWELAEEFGVTEEFMIKAINYYKNA
ncbi:MAG: ImmA/IrrE family metallo-endopeptidase [Oscillospiraceae bacterium]|nr:ImmA/IrrE family metallo-endopeptidase [Oscillospiraceae bacterium]